MKQQLLYFLSLMTVVLIACKKEEELGGSIGETKTIRWEKYLDFNEIPEASNVINFAVSGNGNQIYFSNSNRSIYRHNLTTGETKLLYGGLSAMGTSYVHFIDGTLYTVTVFANKSQFGISTDLGDNIEQIHVATHVPFQPHNSFLYVHMNRLHKLSNGTLVLPDNAGNMTFALSTDGGRTWSSKETQIGYNFIPVHQGNRLFALPSGWQGEFGIGASGGGGHYSDDLGDSWHQSDLKFTPQATDREGNLISCALKQFRKLKNGTWTLYEWEDTWPSATGIRNFNSGGNIDQRHDDIEFDDANNIYLLSGDAIYKTRLD